MGLPIVTPDWRWVVEEETTAVDDEGYEFVLQTLQLMTSENEALAVFLDDLFTDEDYLNSHPGLVFACQVYRMCWLAARRSNDEMLPQVHEDTLGGLIGEAATRQNYFFVTRLRRAMVENPEVFTPLINLAGGWRSLIRQHRDWGMSGLLIFLALERQLAVKALEKDLAGRI